ncbi:Mitotic spindle checkpoint component mad3 [Steccherinum ochraceum]|uniref:Mitotic spindle checkpoint component mad3 n=1 Tax=Steccherinum ochraceum TaxID=92696 RepID=A0A4R0S4H3_9APHY|nr:Mitotic spindle checkpoint component mad3 [Steccherinum ochraceum]
MASNDVFDDSSEPVVDCDVLEAAKENIQPIAKGRRVTALSAILSTPHAQRDSRLASARNRLRINVEIALEDEDDDPLEAYTRFVNWTVESYPQGHSAESGLLELLEEATRVLKNDRDGKWRDDIRYLKLWVLYASYVEKPAIIFKFCMVNEIGTTHALLYEEYAMALEKANRKTEADETYLVGIARKAQPTERLEAKHREFQKRMMAGYTAPAAATPDPAPAGPSTAPRRAVLGDSATSSSSRTRSTRSSSTRQSQEDVFRGPLASSSTPTASRPNARMQIFVDPSGADSPDVAAAPWQELGTRKSRVKENVPEVSKAAGTTLRQAGKSKRTASGSGAPKMAVFVDPGPEEPSASSSSSSMRPPPAPATAKKSRVASGSKSSISIFVDEEADAKGSEPAVPSTPKFVPFQDEDAPASPSSHGASPGTVMKEKGVSPGSSGGLSLSSEAEALRKDPLKNYDADERIVALDG